MNGIKGRLNTVCKSLKYVPGKEARSDGLVSLRRKEIPALVIHGTEDVVIPYIHGVMLAKTIPDSVLYTIEGPATNFIHRITYRWQDRLRTSFFSKIN